jgi:hypothetical protein
VVPSVARAEPPTGGAWQFHRGITFEASLGLGAVNVKANDTSATDGSVAGGALGVGGWLSSDLAITGRLSGLGISDDRLGSGNFICAFFGPSLQYWHTEHLWFAGGLGIATLRTFGEASPDANRDGFGFDLRAGYTFGSSTHSLNVSLELMPGLYAAEKGSGGIMATGASLLAGYQFL